MRLVLGGVRGSTPAPGPDFVRYGGHTSSIAVLADGEAVPRLILDAGTGLTRLTPLFGGDGFRGTILLGHLHWDHTHGLPFFAAGGRDDASVELVMPGQGDGAEETLARVLSPPHFPITPSQLGGRWRFREIEPGPHRVEGFDVLAREIPHKGGRCFGYRVSSEGSSIAYLSDHSPISLGAGPDGMGVYHDAAVELACDVDLLVHDAQYTRADFGPRAHYGHSTVEYAVGLARAAGARSLLLFHHDPARTDDELDAVMASLDAGGLPVRAAIEGADLTVARAPGSP